MTSVFLPGESQGRGSLVGFRLGGCTELDTTEVTQKQQQQQLCKECCYEHVSFPILVCSGYIPRSGIAGSYGGFIPRF